LTSVATLAKLKNPATTLPMELDKEVGGVLVILLEPTAVDARVKDTEDEEEDMEGETTSGRPGGSEAFGNFEATGGFFSVLRTTPPAQVLYEERPLDTLGILELWLATVPLGPQCGTDTEPASLEMCIWAK